MLLLLWASLYEERSERMTMPSTGGYPLDRVLQINEAFWLNETDRRAIAHLTGANTPAEDEVCAAWIRVEVRQALERARGRYRLTCGRTEPVPCDVCNGTKRVPDGYGQGGGGDWGCWKCMPVRFCGDCGKPRLTMEQARTLTVRTNEVCMCDFDGRVGNLNGPTPSFLVDAFRAYYEREPKWGSLHIVLDDRNANDDAVRFCIEFAKERGDSEGEQLAGILLTMSRTQRLRLPSAVQAYQRPEFDKAAEQLTYNHSPTPGARCRDPFCGVCRDMGPMEETKNA